MRKVYQSKVVKLALLFLVVAPTFVALCILFLAVRSDSPFVRIVSVPGILFFGRTFLPGAIAFPHMVVPIGFAATGMN